MIFPLAVLPALKALGFGENLTADIDGVPAMEDGRITPLGWSSILWRAGLAAALERPSSPSGLLRSSIGTAAGPRERQRHRAYQVACTLYSRDGKRAAEIRVFADGKTYLLESECVDGVIFLGRHSGRLAGPFDSAEKAEWLIIAADWFTGRPMSVFDSGRSSSRGSDR